MSHMGRFESCLKVVISSLAYVRAMHVRCLHKNCPRRTNKRLNIDDDKREATVNQGLMETDSNDREFGRFVARDMEAHRLKHAHGAQLLWLNLSLFNRLPIAFNLVSMKSVDDEYLIDTRDDRSAINSLKLSSCDSARFCNRWHHHRGTLERRDKIFSLGKLR